MANSERRLRTVKTVSDLEQVSSDTLAEIIEHTLSLRKHPTLGEGIQMFLLAPESSPDEQLLQLYGGVEDERFRKRFEDGVAATLDSWARAPRGHSFDSFAYLFVLLGHLKPWGTYAALVKFASDERFKGKRGDFEDLHSRLLAIWLEDGLKDQGAEDVCRTDILDPRYAAVCYRALWERYPREGIKRIPDMIAHVAKDGDTLSEVAGVIGPYLQRHVVWGERVNGIRLLFCWTRLTESLRALLCEILGLSDLRIDITIDETGVVLTSLNGDSHSWHLQVSAPRMQVLIPWICDRDIAWAQLLGGNDIADELEAWGQVIG